MPYHKDIHIANYEAEHLYNIVLDVEKYPEFLPWVYKCRITERGEEYFLADLVVKFGAISQKYTSRVSYKKGDANNDWCIDVQLVKGPFKKLFTNWKFKEIGENSTEVFFELDFSFNSMLLEKMIGGIFEKAVMKMTSAFEKRIASSRHS